MNNGLSSNTFINTLFFKPSAWLAFSIVLSLAGCGGTAKQNVAPVAAIKVNKQLGDAPLTVEFDATGSVDKDGSIDKYEWNLTGGVTSTEPLVVRVFQTPGEYKVTLKVTDNLGASATAETLIQVSQGLQNFSVTGTVSVASFTDTDGDVNDPLAPYFDNDGNAIGAEQAINNPTLLNGYVTQTPTGNKEDVFGFKPDLRDIYSVKLHQGDFVSLKIVDIDEGDLDLVLFDAGTGDMVGASQTAEYVESVQANYEGQYIVAVAPFKGRSRYLLKIGDSSLAQGPSARGQSGNFEPDQMIIKRKNTAVQLTENLVEEAQIETTHNDRKRAFLGRINRTNPQTQTKLRMRTPTEGFEYRLALKNKRSFAKLETLKAIKQLQSQADVEYAEPNYKVQPYLTPTDPYFAMQWHYSKIDLPAAWDITTGNSNVVVAVIDTGVLMTHPDLVGKFIDGYDFVSDPVASKDGDGLDADPSDPGDKAVLEQSSWHGTHVSGTIAAAMNNREGGTGIAPNAKVMPIRALGLGGGYTYDIIQAVRYAAGLSNDSKKLPSKAADIINLSFGGAGYTQASADLFNLVKTKNIIVLASSGNENSDEATYPAAYEGVIAVGAVDKKLERASYSNKGPHLKIAAPGGVLVDTDADGRPDGVLSTSVATSATGLQKAYAYYEGTSMATPHVAGIFALMKSVNPGLTLEQLNALLYSGALTVEKGVAGRDHLYGYGLINANKAVLAARGLMQGQTVSALLPNLNELYFKTGVKELSLTLTALGAKTTSVQSIQTSQPWLSVVATNVNSLGVGQYKAIIDRSQLSVGRYKADIHFLTSQGLPVHIVVNVDEGDFASVGNAGKIYVMLLSADTRQVVSVGQYRADPGKYSYSFSKVPIGNYYLVAGTDINFDKMVCNLGEFCGFYPSLNKPEIITITKNRDALDFTLELTTNLDPVLQVKSSDILKPLPKLTL